MIWKLNRLARSMKDLIGWVEYLKGEGVELVITQLNIDTSSPMGKLVFHIFGALDEFQLDIFLG